MMMIPSLTCRESEIGAFDDEGKSVICSFSPLAMNMRQVILLSIKSAWRTAVSDMQVLFLLSTGVTEALIKE